MPYTAKQIEVLKGLEGVRRRPAMYTGSRALRGLHQIIYEVIDNSIDEVLAGYCTHIEVTLHRDGTISVLDDGRGIPVDIHPELKRPGVEVVMTTLHAGSKFGGGGYKVSGGLHGVGVSVTNALSEWLEVEVCRDGKRYRQRYQRGKPVTDLKVVGKAKQTGSLVHFKPDAQIFETVEPDEEVLAARLRELAYLNPGVVIKLANEDSGVVRKFEEKGGISSYVQALNEGQTPLHRRPIYFQGTVQDIESEVAIQYNAGFHDTIVSFVNDINTTEGGTHVSGLKTALTRVVNAWARKTNALREKDPVPSGEDVREGLTTVIALKLREPQFEGQTKTKLGNSEVEGIVNSLVQEKLNQQFEENPPVRNRIIEKVLTAARAREAARRAADLVKRKSGLDNPDLPGKLADCSSRDPDECELFIVEGDSAGGIAKQGRDSRYQAVLPLRGKILNVEKARLDKILANEVIRVLVSALGTGIGNGKGNGNNNGEEEEALRGNNSGFDISRLRYRDIVLMADADVDGSHIRTLLLTFFFRHMRELIEKGHLFIAQPPLYCVRTTKERYYAADEGELQKVLKRLKGKRHTVTRFKGLGEMNADQLAETTMNRQTRRVAKVALKDAEEADRIFSVLMGPAVEPRRQFIVEHAREVRHLDI